MKFVSGTRTRRVLSVGNTGLGRGCAGQEECRGDYLTHLKKMTKHHRVVLLLSILFDHAGLDDGHYIITIGHQEVGNPTVGNLTVVWVPGPV